MPGKMNPEPMSVKEQCVHLCHDIDLLITRYVHEYDLPLVAIIGALQLKVNVMSIDAYDGSMAEDDDEDEETHEEPV